MTLQQGTQLGAYRIVGPLGAGGMGEVYRAQDTKLNRDVAIKILPEAFAQDIERLARFQREAQVLASLNHPNIAAIFMSVAVDTRSGFQAGAPKTLFSGVLNLRSNSGISYDVDPKGNRFLMLRQKEEDSSAAQVRIVLNWFEELHRLAALN